MNEDYIYPPGRGSPRSISPLLFIIGVLLASILGGLFGAGIIMIAAEKNQEAIPVESVTPVPTSVETVLQGIEIEINTAITEAVEKVAPSVVTVINYLPSRRSVFGGVYEQTSSGSGAIISPDGYIITNYHVVEEAESLEVVLADGTTLSARLVGVDPYGDLAVIQAEGEMPGVATWGNSDQLKAGETVIAIGSPLGAFKNTVTVGVVSATGRSIETDEQFQMEGLIQTDAAINQGNSGGPLVNLLGQVVGINTLIVRGSSSDGTVAEGLGFAVPSNVSQTVAEILIKEGYIARPSIGANWGWITPTIAARYRLPVDYGVYLTEIASGGPADQAGLKRGDILTAADDEPFNDDNPFINRLFQYEPGEMVTFSVVRGAEQMEVEVVLGEQ
jgi:serine protease Do